MLAEIQGGSEPSVALLSVVDLCRGISKLNQRCRVGSPELDGRVKSGAKVRSGSTQCLTRDVLQDWGSAEGFQEDAGPPNL